MRAADRRYLVLAAIAAVAVAVALIVGSLVLSGGDGNDSTAAPGELVVTGIPQDGTVLGAAGAQVTLIVYEDIQCPFCRTFAVDAFPGIVEQYVRDGRVKLDFRGLDFLGPDSEEALRLTLAAARQDRAWHLVELLYEHQGQENSGWVTEDLLRTLAGDAGLDVDRAFADAASPAVAGEASAVAAEAARRGVRGTPTFFVQIGDGEPYHVEVAELTTEAFRPVLDDALAS